MSDQPKTAEGGCYCGAVRFRVTFPSRFCAHCHCPNCRRAHGAAFVTYVGFPREQLEFLAGEEVLARYTTETDATRSFCTACGTTLFYEGPRWDGEIHVTRTSIDGDVDREPSAHVYVDHAVPWFRITDDLKRYGGTTGGEPKSD